ncbi:hypothetical protein N9N67_05815 [Bacteriovoracaceae bacterium]|nr:hypothetical protein [Bacteriovoracaceae bacterium]
MKKIIFILICLRLTSSLAFISLNQDGLMIIYSIKNLIESPKELVLKRRYFKARKRYPLITSELSDLPSPQNRCEQRCPNNYTLFNRKKDHFQPQSNKHFLAFLNIDQDFAQTYARTYGFCWGHATLTRNFHYLAEFAPQRDAPNFKSSRQFKIFYSKIIKDIAKNKARVIPGFENLYEFSSNPTIQKILKKMAARKWANLALRLRNLKFVKKVMSQKLFRKEKNKMRNFIDSMIKKIDHNHFPKIVLSSQQQKKRMHTVLVYQVKQIDATLYRLCLLDNDEYSAGLKNCQVYVDLNLGNLTGYYTKWDTKYKHLDGSVGQIDFSTEDTYEFVKSFKSAHKLCMKRCQEEN